MICKPIDILKDIISIYSPSRNEADVSDYLENLLRELNCNPVRIGNNILCEPQKYDSQLPTVMLNSHIDTVNQTAGWTKNPCNPLVENGRLYGLGANDAGAAVVSLISVYANYRQSFRNFNLILALSCEEEVGGEGGMRLLLDKIKDKGYDVDMAIVGEPTSMKPAIAERGLVVLDCECTGISGHAARNEGVNAIYKAIEVITKLKEFRFEKESEILGLVKLTITIIEAGTQHNVIPALCKFVVDIRNTDAYSNEEIVRILQDEFKQCKITPRSTRVRASVLNKMHPLSIAAESVFGDGFISPTTSDCSLLKGLPALKIGPGNSSRSHKADEFVYVNEITDGIEGYLKLLKELDRILENGQ